MLEYFHKSSHSDGLNSWCILCTRKDQKQKYDKKKNDPHFREKERKRGKIYRQKNPELLKKINQRYRATGKGREAHRRWKHTPEGKKQRAEYQRAIRNTVKGRAAMLAAAAKRRLARRNACPPWLSDSQYNEMKVIYLKAVSMEKKTGEKYHVDHIAPLQGENICGLHVPWNLEPITAAANLMKANHIDEERLDREQFELAKKSF
jgi:hypothetical protein